MNNRVINQHIIRSYLNRVSELGTGQGLGRHRRVVMAFAGVNHEAPAAGENGAAGPAHHSEVLLSLLARHKTLEGTQKTKTNVNNDEPFTSIGCKYSAHRVLLVDSKGSNINVCLRTCR